MKNLLCWAVLLSLPVVAHSEGGAPFSAPAEASANVFQGTQALKFTFGSPAETPQKVAWKVKDWQGKLVLNGEVLLKSGEPLTLPALPPGYYRLGGAANDAAFGALPFAVVREPRPTVDSPYCLDSAQTTILRASEKLNPRQPANAYDILGRLIKLSGVAMSRERMNWPSIVSGKEGYQWKSADRPVNNLAAAGIPVLNMFTQAPASTKGDLQSVPRDLVPLYAFSKEAASHYQGKVVAWEFWNEPDDMYCADAAWDFASAQKAAYAGFRAGNPAARVLIGANANTPTPKFIEVALQNGAGDFFDTYNFHTYAAPGALPGIAAEKRGVLAKYGLGEKAIWVTEIGLQSEGSGGESAGIAGTKIAEHNAMQEMQQARFLVYAFLTGQAHGIERMFFFALPPYNEQDGLKVWGLLRWDWSVKPGYVALANLTAQLAGAKLLGNYDLAPGTIAYLFQREHDQVLVSWADNSVEAEIPGAAKARVVDMMGGERALNGATAKIGPDPQYFTGLQGLEPVPTLAKPPLPTLKNPAVDHDVVFSIRFLDGVKISNRITADLGGMDARKAELIITSFADQPRKIDLRNLSQGLACSDLPSSITAAPMKATSVPFSVRFAEEKTPLCYLRLGGHTSNGDISPLHVPMKPPGDVLASARAVQLPTDTPGAWIPSAAALMSSEPSPEAGATRFLVHFPSNTARWVYPRFDTKARKIDFTGSIGISFEVRLLQPSDATQVHKAYLMLNARKNGKGSNFQFAYRPVAAWNRVAYTWDQDAPNGFDPASVTAIQIGMNSKASDVVYEVRRVTLYYGDQPAP